MTYEVTKNRKYKNFYFTVWNEAGCIVATLGGFASFELAEAAAKDAIALACAE